MLKQANGELATGSVSLLIGVVGLVELARQPAQQNMGGDLGPTFLPSSLLYLMIGLGVLLIARAIYFKSSKASIPKMKPTPVIGEEEAPTALAPFWRIAPFLLLVGLCAYGLAMTAFGFEASTVVFLFTCGLVIQVAKTQKFQWRFVLLSATEAIVATAALTLLFRFALFVPLP